jgi:hypothetical protein
MLVYITQPTVSLWHIFLWGNGSPVSYNKFLRKKYVLKYSSRPRVATGSPTAFKCRRVGKGLRGRSEKRRGGIK